MADRVGQRLGNYTIMQSLGQGGFAEVYLGEHVYLQSLAAVKVLQTRLSSTDDMDSFLREAQTIARLFHPHIIRIMDFGVENETPYLVMDYAPNGTLRQRHPRNIPVPLATVVLYVKQIASALQYAQEELRLIHRDIKPENMLIGRRNEVLLSDFGIALVAQSSRSQGIQDVIGTVAYMAPEQIQGKPHTASDQYSLGIVVYEWLNGDRPFHGSFTEMCTQHIFAAPPPFSQKIPSLPPNVERVVMQTLAKDPRQRFESIQAFANALEQASLFQQGQQTELMPPTFYSLPLQAQPNNTHDLSQSAPRVPAMPPSTPPASLLSGPAGPSQFAPIPFTQPRLFAQPRNQQPATTDDFSPPFGSWSYQPGSQPEQAMSQKIVLPAPSTFAPHYPAANNNPQNASIPLAPQPPPYAARQQYAPQQQAIALQRYSAPHSTEQPYNTNAYPSLPEAQSDRQQQQDKGFPSARKLLFIGIRQIIATGLGILLFCFLNYFHPFMFNRSMLLILAVPLFFGAAFGPLVGALVGLGGVFAINAISPIYVTAPFTVAALVHASFSSLYITNIWWSPLLINGLPGFMAGLSMLRRRRYPSIGSAISGSILGAMGLFGSIGFVLYKLGGLTFIKEFAVSISTLISLNVAIAFALLVIYTIMGMLLDA